MDAAFLTDTNRDTLRHSVLCSAMNDGEMSNILATGTVTTLEANSFLFEQGDPAKNLFIILDGWAQISRLERDGSTTLIAAFHKGESLAEVAALLGRPYPGSGQAMTPLKVLSINGSMLLDIMQNNRAILAQSLASVYQKLHSLIEDVEWLKSRTIRERLAKFLLDETKTGSFGNEARLPYSKSLIAAKIGTSPQQLSRTFSELQQFGVRISGQSVVIDNRTMLKSMLQKT